MVLGEAGECAMPGHWAFSMWGKTSAAFRTSSREIFTQSGSITEPCL